ncbi:MAG: L-threonylcarbamoyladenylate synthase, partial [Candidatus Komeilibacteria bacterium]|nr:L-threonylcarbamoyladenylate synthase [Candidatus Komeilibacteria bacterium]
RSAAIERIYELKKRSVDSPFVVIIGEEEDLLSLGVQISREQHEIMRKLWPGPVSIILSCLDEGKKYLHRGRNSLAVRLPATDWLRRLLRETGPLVATSANISGDPFITQTGAAQATFGDEIDFYVDQGELKGTPSALVDLTGTEPAVIRPKNTSIIDLQRYDQ